VTYTGIGTPAAEIMIDADLVRALLREQHPDLADLPLERMASGWDNEIFRLGDHLGVRLPRRAAAASLLLNEQRWLPLLSTMLPVSVPVPLRLGRPGATYPWRWSVVPWLKGAAADIRHLDPGQAPIVADFLSALHRAAPLDAPRNPFRGCGLADRAEALERRISRLEARTASFNSAVRAVWERALSVPIDVQPTWIHGDLHPLNVLVDAARLSAVIDWGDAAAGDRATDLACLWMLFSETERRQAMDRYGPVSVHTWTRARGWAVLLGTIFVDAGLDGDARFMQIGERTLRRVAEDA
jgi:aminoglycoside phosphotransferase (APT) family kinase protein